MHHAVIFLVRNVPLVPEVSIHPLETGMEEAFHLLKLVVKDEVAAGIRLIHKHDHQQNENQLQYALVLVQLDEHQLGRF